MTYSAYIIHHAYHHNDYDWEKEIAEIKAINPDIILCMCMEEFDYIYIFRNFFPKITPWLVENNKIAKVLVPNPDNVKINEHIVTESTSGIYIFFTKMLSEQLPTNVVPDKVFTCYNNQPKQERALLVDELAKRHLLQHGIVTFHFPNNIFRDTITNKEFEGWKYHDGSILVDEEDFKLNSKTEFTAPEFPKSFQRGFLDIVCESNIKEHEYFFTEKTAKSIGAFKPFITLANPYYHTKFLVDEFGIELYDELFDYSFDTILDTNKRIEAIVDNIERIVGQYNEHFRTSILDTIKPKLIRNRERLVAYGKDKYKMVPRSLQFLLSNEPYNLYGNTDKLEQFNLSYYRTMGWM